MEDVCVYVFIEIQLKVNCNFPNNIYNIPAEYYPRTHILHPPSTSKQGLEVTNKHIYNWGCDNRLIVGQAIWCKSKSLASSDWPVVTERAVCLVCRIIYLWCWLFINFVIIIICWASLSLG